VAALAGGPLPALAYRFESADRSIAITGSGVGRDAFVALAEGATLIVVEAIHGGALDLALASPDVENLEGTRREAALHLRLEDVGGLATDASAKGVALTRLRPPPPFDFVYANRVQETFRGPVFILEDGELVTP
jgi:ribonuclease BN (tRNA processing enzyme)